MTTEELAALPALQKGWAWVRLGELSIGAEYGSAAKSKEKQVRFQFSEWEISKMGDFDWQNLVYSLIMMLR